MLYRSFIALQLSVVSRHQLAEMADHYQVQDKYNEISWSDNENYHVTLAFLGNQTASDLQLLAEQLGFTVQLDTNFSVTTTELSYFPYHSRPKLLAAILKLDAELERLKNQVDQVLHNSGICYDKRKFIPHITLGRVRGRKSPRLAVPPSYIDLKLSCLGLTLFRSELHSYGAVHTPIYSIETELKELEETGKTGKD